MKASRLILMCTPLLLAVSGCDAERRTAPPPAGGGSDAPLLPVKPGDSWTYEVELEIPAGVTSPGAAAISTKYERIRTYLGKLPTKGDLPQADCFEVSSPGSPTEYEYVEIADDRILMRGSHVLLPDSHPVWLDPPIPFAISGMKPGDTLADVVTSDAASSRQTRVLAREEITTPAGSFRCIRLLITGKDADLELHRTVWFAPGTGIIREEKSRHRLNQPVFRETQELLRLERPR